MAAARRVGAPSSPPRWKYLRGFPGPGPAPQRLSAGHPYPGCSFGPPRRPLCPDFPNCTAPRARPQPSPGRTPRPPPPEPRRPQGGNKSVSAASGVPQSRAGGLPPEPELQPPFPGRAEVNEPGRGASPANFTNLPEVAGQRRRPGFQIPELWAPETTERGSGGRREVCRQVPGRGGVCECVWRGLYPVPILTRFCSPRTRTYTPGRPAAAPPAAAALTSSSFLLLARDTFCICKASREQPRTLLPSGRCGVAAAAAAAAAAPSTCARTRVVGAFASRPGSQPAHCTLPCPRMWGWGAHDFLKSPSLPGGIYHTQCVPHICYKYYVCTGHDFAELTPGVLQALINSVTLIAPPPGGPERVAIFLYAFIFW